MNETTQILVKRSAGESWFSRFEALALIAITLVAIIGKFYLPRLLPHTEWLELPLLLTVFSFEELVTRLVKLLF